MTICEAVKDATHSYLGAIAEIVSEKEGKFEGTGSIIEFGNGVFLITAAHVVSKIVNCGYHGVAYSNGNKKLYSRAPSHFDSDAALDVAFARIPRPTQPDSDRLACPQRLIAASAVGTERDLLFIHGFPGRHSRFFKMTEGIHSTTLPYCSGPGTPKWAEFDASSHFAISYDPKNSLLPGGGVADLPSPDGLSGAAVWNTRRSELRETWTPSDARIVGIVHRWDQDGECLIATRIEKILPFLQRIEERGNR